jgi:hypothetical protein
MEFAGFRQLCGGCTPEAGDQWLLSEEKAHCKKILRMYP